MKDKKFITPAVLYGGGIDTGGGSVIGGGSGQSTPDLFDTPMDYEMWFVLAEDFPDIYDYDKDGDPGTWEDYYLWYINTFPDLPAPIEP